MGHFWQQRAHVPCEELEWVVSASQSQSLGLFLEQAGHFFTRAIELESGLIPPEATSIKLVPPVQSVQSQKGCLQRNLRNLPALVHRGWAGRRWRRQTRSRRSSFGGRRTCWAEQPGCQRTCHLEFWVRTLIQLTVGFVDFLFDLRLDSSNEKEFLIDCWKIILCLLQSSTNSIRRYSKPHKRLTHSFC